MSFYKFTDENGVTRLFAEITPDPAFNGGTITGPLGIAPTTYTPVGTALQVVGKDAVPIGTTIMQVQDNLGNDIFDVDDLGAVDILATGSGRGFTLSDGGGALVRFRSNGGAGTVGFYRHAPVAQQTGVAVTAAAIHAALVNLGLITA